MRCDDYPYLSSTRTIEEFPYGLPMASIDEDITCLDFRKKGALLRSAFSLAENAIVLY